jgi:hypothetical protein
MSGLGLAGLLFDIIWALGLSGLVTNLLIVLFTVGLLGRVLFLADAWLAHFPPLFVRGEAVTVVYRYQRVNFRYKTFVDIGTLWMYIHY